MCTRKRSACWKRSYDPESRTSIGNLMRRPPSSILNACSAIASRRLTCSLLLATTLCCGFSTADELVRLKYNHPGLVVDLGRRSLGLARAVRCRRRRRLRPDRLLPGQTVERRVAVREQRPATRRGRSSRSSSPRGGSARRCTTSCRAMSTARCACYRRARVSEFRGHRPAGSPWPSSRHSRSTLPQGHATGGRANKVRHNQWRYVDYDGDGRLDLIVGIEDWSDYGWDDACDAQGRWTNGPLHGFVYWLRNTGSNDEPAYAPASARASGRPRCRRLRLSLARISPTSTATATSIFCAVSFSMASPTSRTSAPAPHPDLRPGGS